MKKISRKLWYVLLMVIVISGMLLFIPGSLYACNPGISLTKTANSTSATPGDTITYTFEVKNTGDVGLKDVTLSDPMLDFGYGLGVGINLGNLAVGATFTPNPTAIYVVQTADIGSLVNTATVTSTADVNNGTGTPTASDTATATVTVTAPTPTDGGAPAGPAVYTITATTEGPGSITDLGIFNISANADKIYSMTPDGGASIVDVLVNGVSVGAGPSYTFLIVNSNQTIHVKFGTIAVAAITEKPAEEVIEVAAITEEVIEVAAITELPRTGNNMLFYVIGFALMAVGVAFGSFFIPKALRKREN